jgi:hypothetical protein
MQNLLIKNVIARKITLGDDAAVSATQARGSLETLLNLSFPQDSSLEAREKRRQYHTLVPL